MSRAARIEMTTASTQIREMSEALHGDVDSKRDALIAAIQDALNGYAADPSLWRIDVLRQTVTDLENYEAGQ